MISKEQVESFARSKVEYEEARRDVVSPELRRVGHYIEPVSKRGTLAAMADAVGESVVRTAYDDRVSWSFEFGGVEFYCIEWDR